jgi:glutaredoxin
VPVSDSLPALELRDDTAELLITWVDEKGDHHVVAHPLDVPEEGRALVRVVTVDQGHGAIFYVADLRQKKADGSYAVRTMSRSEWELIAEQRRQKAIAALAPPPTASASDGGVGTPPIAQPSAQLTAIVYGASWCSACRSAERYLRTQGVTVIPKDIERDAGAKAEMDAKLKRANLPMRGTIPVIDLRGKILVGLDEREIRRTIKSVTTGDML